MAVEKNTAYNLSLFEAEVKKKDNVITLPREKKDYKKRHRVANMVFTMTLAGICVSVLSTVIYGQIKLTELTDQIGIMVKELEEKQSISTQLQMKIESSFALRSVEKYAKENLDMGKTSSYQVEYVNLFGGDKAELDLGKKKLGILDKLKDIFSSLR